MRHADGRLIATVEFATYSMAGRTKPKCSIFSMQAQKLDQRLKRSEHGFGDRPRARAAPATAGGRFNDPDNEPSPVRADKRGYRGGYTRSPIKLRQLRRRRPTRSKGSINAPIHQFRHSATAPLSHHPPLKS